jgi:dolichol kinase
MTGRSLSGHSLSGHSLWRSLFHFSGIVIPVTCLFLGRGAALTLDGLLLLASIVVETLRITGRLRLTLAQKYIKEKEKRGPTGSFYFLLGSLLTLLFFDTGIAVPVIMVLAVSDPLSSLVGRTLGRTRFLGKSLEGACAFFLSSAAILAFFSLDFPRILVAAFVMTGTELFTGNSLDDNLTIPLAGGFALWLLL